MTHNQRAVYVISEWDDAESFRKAIDDNTVNMIVDECEWDDEDTGRLKDLVPDEHRDSLVVLMDHLRVAYEDEGEHKQEDIFRAAFINPNPPLAEGEAHDIIKTALVESIKAIDALNDDDQPKRIEISMVVERQSPILAPKNSGLIV